MAVIPFGTLKAEGAPILRREILTNSITTSVADSVKVASGFVALGTTGAQVFGHVSGIGTNFGVGLNTTGVAGAETGSFVGTFLTSSTNQTVEKVRAEVDISRETLYAITANATLGTTTGSNLLGYRIDLADEDDLSESSATTGAAQYFIWGVDPKAPTTRAVVSIYESQVFGV